MQGKRPYFASQSTNHTESDSDDSDFMVSRKTPKYVSAAKSVTEKNTLHLPREALNDRRLKTFRRFDFSAKI